jgi:hypothetical protein
MTNLVDRYVYTALRRIPEQQRGDIDRELRASIEDAVEARISGGESPEAAVEGALTELGDPDRLADQYANRPDYLIGPALYPSWRRLTKMLLATVLPVVVAVVVVIQLLDDPDVGKVIGAAIGTALTVGVHMVFWSTLVFYIVDRAGASSALRTTWSLKDLPRYEANGMTVAQMAPVVAWSAMLIAGLVLQQFTFTSVPLLDPANWTFWWPFLVVALTLRGAYAIWVWRLGVWNRTVTVVNAVVSLLTTVPLIWLLARDQFFNPDFGGFLDPANTNGQDVQRWVSLSLIAILVVGAAWEIFDVTRRGEQARRGVPSKVPGTGGTYNFGA